MRPLLMFSLVGACLLGGCSRKEPAAEPVRAVRVVTVAPQAVGGAFEYAAEIKPRIESRLGFRVGGKIIARSVNVGDRVKPGQPLARIDARDFQLSQDSARAGQNAARVAQEQAQSDFKRYKDLRDQGFISSAELERRETTLKSAQAQLEQSNAQLTAQGNQAGYAVLVAADAGVVTAVEAEPGMVVASGATVVRVALDGPRDVVFAVPEDKVEIVKSAAARPGNLKVKLWGMEGDGTPATIREIAAAADPVTRTFLFKADVGSAAGPGVRIGQTATVSIELPRQTGVAKLPLTALREERGSSAVWIVDKAAMAVQMRKVHVAGVDGNEAVIANGLAVGDIVVTAGVHVLTPGQKVRFYVDPSAPSASSTSSANR